MGGEKFIIMSSKTDSTGSPPRGRGKVWLFPLLPAVHRITPAWAGKRATPRKNGCPGGDHPRVGGEKLLRLVKKPPLWGSPPRGRGKVVQQPVIVVLTGITPAWAGKSPSRIDSGAGKRDHPRVGGEKHQLPVVVSGLQGSPPRGRGKGGHENLYGCCLRITPAWAGKRKRETTQKRKSGDHPRVGGEKSALRRMRSQNLGSPPRGRGKVNLGPQLFPRYGITPAWAGKSICCRFA